MPSRDFHISITVIEMIITMSNATPEVPEFAIILDLDYIMFLQDGLLMEAFDGWLEEAHSAIEKTFESCITDRCRFCSRRLNNAGSIIDKYESAGCR